MNLIRKLFTDCEDVSLSIIDASGSDRALTEVTSQVFLLILAIGLIGGLAVTLSGITDGILPGPEGNVEIQQSGDTVSVTIDTLDDDVDEVAITVSEHDNNNEVNLVSDEDDISVEGADYRFETTAAGQTGSFDVDIPDDETATVNVIAYDEDNDQSNRIATYTAS